MTDYNGYEAYKRNDIESKVASASPAELILMMIDGFTDELDRVEGHLQQKDYERKSNSIGKCLDILAGLETMLDKENGGELAQNLSNLYDFMQRRLFEISLKNDESGLDDLRQIMSELREGWAGLGTQAA